LRKHFAGGDLHARRGNWLTNLAHYKGTQKMIADITSNEMWIITALVTATACIFVAYLLHKAGAILQEQDKRTEEERDTQSNYEHWND
jgi:hypothetical protein